MGKTTKSSGKTAKNPDNMGKPTKSSGKTAKNPDNMGKIQHEQNTKRTTDETNIYYNSSGNLAGIMRRF